MFWLKKITVSCPHLQVTALKRILYDSRCLKVHMQTTSALALYGLSPGNVLSEHIKQFLCPLLLSLPLCKGSQLL